MQVGPESAGAHPGPVCYRKPGGLPALTDANLALGRILPVRRRNLSRQLLRRPMNQAVSPDTVSALQNSPLNMHFLCRSSSHTFLAPARISLWMLRQHGPR